MCETKNTECNSIDMCIYKQHALQTHSNIQLMIQNKIPRSCNYII